MQLSCLRLRVEPNRRKGHFAERFFANSLAVDVGVSQALLLRDYTSHALWMR